MSYDRYKKFRINEKILTVPFIPIRQNDSDLFINFKRNFNRLDLISYDYYGDASYGWLILQANPDYGTNEFNIPNNVVIRIPYPLNAVILNYEQDIDNYIKYYGLDE